SKRGSRRASAAGSGLAAGATSGVFSKCSVALKIAMQAPQRTFPCAAFRWASVTRKVAPQWGHRVSKFKLLKRRLVESLDRAAPASRPLSEAGLGSGGGLVPKRQFGTVDVSITGCL